MLTICRSLLGNPDLILIDEPTEGLAPRIVETVMKAIVDIHRAGVAVLLVEQNVPLTLEAGQRIYFIEKGVVRHHAMASDLRVNDAVIHQYLGV